MSQYCSRIHIKVSDPEVWRRFETVEDEGFELAKLAGQGETSFVFDMEFSKTDSELYGVVYDMAKILKTDGIIIADTTNINVDPNDYCVFYFGDMIHDRAFNIYSGAKKCNMHFDTEIRDIAGWLNYGGFRASEKEAEQLLRCGILVDGKLYRNFSNDLELPYKIYLRETSFDNRADAIERLSLGESVKLIHAGDSYDPERIEVISENGSLGYMPSEVSDKIAPLVLSDKFEYFAKIVELVPQSKRNKHTRSSKVAVHVDAALKQMK